MAPSSSKWTSTLASTWIQSAAGAPYCFSIYSPLLKTTQSYSQSTLATVAFFKDVGGNVGTLAGLLLHYSHSPWIILSAGAAQCFAGYLLIWLSVTAALPRQPVPLMCLYMFIAAHAQPFFNTANVVTGVRNFPRHRGTVVGIVKGFLGLSGAILIQVYQTVFSGRPQDFVLMIALLPSVLSLLLMHFVKVYPTGRGDDKKLLGGFSLVALVVAGYLMVVILLENFQTPGSLARVLTFIVLILLLASPIGIVVRAQLRDSRIISEPPSLERVRLMDDSDTSEVRDQRKRNDIPLVRDENMNLLQAMKTLNFWLLFLATACGMGSGLATINNVGQIGSSLGYTIMETSALISLWSIWNFLGRFGAGYISDYFLLSRGYARPLFMAITLVAMSAGHLLIASGFPGALYVGSILVGVCYGSQWSLMPTITSEIFSLTHLGTIFNTIAIASPFGSYILSVRVVGYLYDMETASSESKGCTGRHCFMLSFLIMASVSLLGSVVAFILFRRTKLLYEEICATVRQSDGRLSMWSGEISSHLFLPEYDDALYVESLNPDH